MRISDTRLQNLRKWMADQAVRPVDLADLLGKAPAQVSAFAGPNPKRGIGDKIARQIEAAAGLSEGFLDRPHDYDQNMPSGSLPRPSRKIPVMSSMAARFWYENPDLRSTAPVAEWIEAPGEVSHNAFAILVEGVSMEPKLREGDKVIIEPNSSAQPGQYVAVFGPDSDSIILRQLKQEGTEQYLYTANPNWPERIARLPNHSRIVGRAVWSVADL